MKGAHSGRPVLADAVLLQLAAWAAAVARRLVRRVHRRRQRMAFRQTTDGRESNG